MFKPSRYARKLLWKTVVKIPLWEAPTIWFRCSRFLKKCARPCLLLQFSWMILSSIWHLSRGIKDWILHIKCSKFSDLIYNAKIAKGLKQVIWWDQYRSDIFKETSIGICQLRRVITCFRGLISIAKIPSMI